MLYCINPHCPKPLDPANTGDRICRNCGSQLWLQDRYRVIRQLGKGGFGKTFEVDDKGTLKVLKILTDNTPKAIELFRQEAKVLSQLKNAGIPKVEADGYFTILPKNSSEPLHCLVMEKIGGVNLEQWMESRNYQPLPETQALNWLKQLTEILALVHTHQYFHRDIKPQNIMLRPNGQLVLIDFGAVRQITTTIKVGNSNTRIISQGYSPPEQQNGYSVQQSDFFALGRTFIFLLTGKEPQDKDIYDPLTNKLNWQKYASHISQPLADLIDHLMAHTANQRPQNTEVILQRLHEIKTPLSKHLTSSKNYKSYSLPNISGGVSKSVQIQSTPHKIRKIWGWIISLSVGYLAIIIALDKLNNKTVIPPEEKIPIPAHNIPHLTPAVPNPQPQVGNKVQIQSTRVNITDSERLQAERDRKRQNRKIPKAIFKARRYRQQSSIKIKSDNKEHHRLEPPIRERKIQLPIYLGKKEQTPQQKIGRRKQQANHIKQAILIKHIAKNVIIPHKQHSLGLIQPKRRKTKNIESSNNNIVQDKPWESKYPIHKSSDELEQVIREGSQQ